MTEREDIPKRNHNGPCVFCDNLPSNAAEERKRYPLIDATHLQQQVADERREFPLGGGNHTFIISVNMRGCGADYSTNLESIEVKASCLVDALQAAIDRPFANWFPIEEKGLDSRREVTNG